MTGKRYMAVLLTVCMVLTACDSHGDKQTEASGTPHVEHHDKERQQLKRMCLSGRINKVNSISGPLPIAILVVERYRLVIGTP